MDPFQRAVQRVQSRSGGIVKHRPTITAEKKIEELQAEVADLKSHTDNLSNDLLTLAQERQVLRAEVTRLREHLTELRQDAKECDIKAWVMKCDEALEGGVDKKKPKPRPDDWNEEYLEMG